MKKILAILFTIMLAFAPIVAATPQLTEEAITIPREDFDEYVNIFIALSRYDELIKGVMVDMNIMVEDLRVRFNENIENTDDVTVAIIQEFLNHFNWINYNAAELYVDITDKTKFSEGTINVVEELLMELEQ
jgi:hypothetical protein